MAGPRNKQQSLVCRPGHLDAVGKPSVSPTSPLGLGVHQVPAQWSASGREVSLRQDGPLGDGGQEGTAHRGRRGWHVGVGGWHTWPQPEPRKPS